MNDNESIGMIYNKKAATENKTNWIGEELARKFHNVSMLVQFLFSLSLSVYRLRNQIYPADSISNRE